MKMIKKLMVVLTLVGSVCVGNSFAGSTVRCADRTLASVNVTATNAQYAHASHTIVFTFVEECQGSIYAAISTENGSANYILSTALIALQSKQKIDYYMNTSTVLPSGFNELSSIVIQ